MVSNLGLPPIPPILQLHRLSTRGVEVLFVVMTGSIIETMQIWGSRHESAATRQVELEAHRSKDQPPDSFATMQWPSSIRIPQASQATGRHGGQTEWLDRCCAVLLSFLHILASTSIIYKELGHARVCTDFQVPGEGLTLQKLPLSGRRASNTLLSWSILDCGNNQFSVNQSEELPIELTDLRASSAIPSMTMPTASLTFLNRLTCSFYLSGGAFWSNCFTLSFLPITSGSGPAWRDLGICLFEPDGDDNGDVLIFEASLLARHTVVGYSLEEVIPETQLDDLTALDRSMSSISASGRKDSGTDWTAKEL
ncbi:uncharacterized protein CLUP02_09353 [Colletotrichum lupini]|uniref:Uncharacterized protein n=1 Tax=Colletotrichum lupini TaxID=145971 RepID=A0A9Q8WIB8_9PEZI|nr:uncharacterized protein CLUP02_09353 [Colletotrichum lupini]UQC83857.1 hypothetical protein CLUP02_09353 [Colletotrichum lupini]